MSGELAPLITARGVPRCGPESGTPCSAVSQAGTYLGRLLADGYDFGVDGPPLLRPRALQYAVPVVGCVRVWQCARLPCTPATVFARESSPCRPMRLLTVPLARLCKRYASIDFGFLVSYRTLASVLRGALVRRDWCEEIQS